MEVDYYSKYLKYKSKYTELKKQIGAGSGKCTNIDEIYNPKTRVLIKKPCTCQKFKAGSSINCIQEGCGHSIALHE